MSEKVVIVGAGPGGLAAAMLLAYRGFEVTVLEKQSYVGGRTSTIEAEGFRFDRGPTFFLYPRILEEIFAETGYDLFRECPMKRLDPQYRLVFGAGGQLDATPHVERMQQEIAKLSPGDERGLERFLSENRTKMERFRSILESPFYTLSDLFRPDVLRSLPLVRPYRTLHSEVGRYFRDPRLRLAFTFQGKYLGMSPFQCPSLFSILSFLEYEHGVFHPLGGCGAVSRRMAELAQELGTEVRLGEKVEAIEFEGRRAVAVRTPENTYPCDALVINADFAQSMVDLVPDRLRRRWTDRKLARKKFSCSTFMMYLGLDGEQAELPHHTIYLSKNYEENLKDIESGRRLTEDTSFYVQNPCVTDPDLAPPGQSTLYILAPVAHEQGHLDWRELRDRFRRRVLSSLSQIGLENVEPRIRYEHVITPRDWRLDYGLYRGATFNLAHSLQQMLYWRPHNRFEDLQGVYLVGGGTHPGSGLPTIYSSARITSTTLCEDFSSQGAQSRGTAKKPTLTDPMAPASV